MYINFPASAKETMGKTDSHDDVTNLTHSPEITKDIYPALWGIVSWVATDLLSIIVKLEGAMKWAYQCNVPQHSLGMPCPIALFKNTGADIQIS